MSGSNYYLLKNCKYVITPTEGGDIKVLRDVDILISDGVIESVGEGLREVPQGADRLDMSNHIVTPGFVNAHTHAAMVIFRGYADDEELKDWLVKVWRVESRLTPKLIHKASLLACYEMLLSGTTLFQDMYSNYVETVGAAKEVGIRARAGPVCIGGRCELSGIEGINYELFKPIINVHSLYSLSIDDVLKCFKYAMKLGIDVQIHVSETRWEVFDIRSRTGKFPVELMSELGILNKSTYLVHLNWVTSWELREIAKSGAKVAVCPSSSMKLANSGFTPIYELDRLGVLITLGTDGACSANRLDVINEVRQLILLYRHNYWDTRVSSKHAFRYVTINGFKAMGIRAGIIDVGYEADLVGISIRNPWMRPLTNPLSIVTYSIGRSDIDYVLVKGEPKLTPTNRVEILERVNQLWDEVEDEVKEILRLDN